MLGLRLPFQEFLFVLLQNFRAVVIYELAAALIQPTTFHATHNATFSALEWQPNRPSGPSCL